jgi:hypothetical protein
MKSDNLDSNGYPNFTNPLILASFIDLIGSSLTTCLNSMGKNGGMPTDDDLYDLCNIQRILLAMRGAVGAGHEWANDNLFPLAQELCEESNAAIRNRKPTPAQVAEKILHDLNN